LRLVDVIDVEDAPLPANDDFALEMEYGEGALREASTYLESVGEVKLDRAVPMGRVGGILAAQSLGASMVCVGSVGIGWVASKLLGSTAASLAERHGARSPLSVAMNTRWMEGVGSLSRWLTKLAMTGSSAKQWRRHGYMTRPFS
jgi:hypothetical protein